MQRGSAPCRSIRPAVVRGLGEGRQRFRYGFVGGELLASSEGWGKRLVSESTGNSGAAGVHFASNGPDGWADATVPSRIIPNRRRLAACGNLGDREGQSSFPGLRTVTATLIVRRLLPKSRVLRWC
jgi:hypothetical protein